MKKFLLFFFFLSLVLACTNQGDVCKGPLEGFWELQYYEWSWDDTTVTWTMDEWNQQTKIFGKDNYAFLKMGPAWKDSMALTIYGGKGTYTLTGDTLVETVELWDWMAMIGQSVTFRVEFRGDSMIQTGPITADVPEGWESFQLMEVYTRME